MREIRSLDRHGALRLAMTGKGVRGLAMTGMGCALSG